MLTEKRLTRVKFDGYSSKPRVSPYIDGYCSGKSQHSIDMKAKKMLEYIE
jgi:hypothetical protein